MDLFTVAFSIPAPWLLFAASSAQACPVNFSLANFHPLALPPDSLVIPRIYMAHARCVVTGHHLSSHLMNLEDPVSSPTSIKLDILRTFNAAVVLVYY